MFGFGIYLMRLIDYFEDKKYKKCKVCSKSFKGKDKLTRHMEEQHSSNEFNK